VDNILWFKNICRKNRFNVSDSQVLQIDGFVDQLLQWNKKLNLISRKDEENIWVRHILGSVSFLFRISLRSKSSVVDVGTGGGLPGIPLAILLPEIQFTLIDSIQKKVNAISDILPMMKLPNVRAVCGRAEEISRKKEYQYSFDYVVARAVAPVKDIVTWCKPFLKMKGDEADVPEGEDDAYVPRSSILMLKGGDLTDELKEAQVKTSPRSIRVFPIIVSGTEQSELSDKKIIILKP